MIYKNVELYNVEELMETEHNQGKFLMRIPNNLRLKLVSDGGKVSALASSGCEIRFNLKSNSAKIVLTSPEGPSIAEIYQGCFDWIHPASGAKSRLYYGKRRVLTRQAISEWLGEGCG